jgi:hypothetical protein
MLADNVAGSVVTRVSAQRGSVDGLPVMAVRIDAVLPLIGLLGPASVTVEGHALREEAR